jgi:hypothetical protein
VAEIKGSRELGGSQGKSPRVGCSKSRVAKSRGAETVVGSREREDRWIRTPWRYRISGVRGFEGWKGSLPTVEVAKCRESRLVRTRGTSIRWGPRD